MTIQISVTNDHRTEGALISVEEVKLDGSSFPGGFKKKLMPQQRETFYVHAGNAFLVKEEKAP